MLIKTPLTEQQKKEINLKTGPSFLRVYVQKRLFRKMEPVAFAKWSSLSVSILQHSAKQDSHLASM